ncbi:hypothetical protein RJT34_19375 [Clitoria ternatea]|uniref:Protein transport protein sec16 n=1 Tax=Clitoria ternatea TaxID=43366 RepID=A0AAN9IR78_CLITE
MPRVNHALISHVDHLKLKSAFDIPGPFRPRGSQTPISHVDHAKCNNDTLNDPLIHCKPIPPLSRRKPFARFPRSHLIAETCFQSNTPKSTTLPGPLVGGSVGSKELYRWLDERIAHCQLLDMDYKKGERLKLLFSLLKIACQHYGKLRSPFGSDTILKENDTPESEVAKLFASAKMRGPEFPQYGMPTYCLQNLPSEGQMRAMASEVQNLLVSGKKKEALQCAQEGQLWGPALVLSSQLGELVQGIIEAVKRAGHAICGGHISGMFRFFFTDGPVYNFADAKKSDTAKFTRFFWGMLAEVRGRGKHEDDHDGVLIRDIVVVSQDGSGNFTTVNDAVAAAPNNANNATDGYFLIFIREGVYEEYVSIPQNKAYLMMIEDGINCTIITGNHSWWMDNV